MKHLKKLKNEYIENVMAKTDLTNLNTRHTIEIKNLNANCIWERIYLKSYVSGL